MADAPKPPSGPETPDPHSREARSVRAQAKRKLLADLLDQGKVMIRLDARRPGVQVPETLNADNDLALNLSWRFANTEMKLTERAIEATLRFQGVPFRCVVPWNAIWGMATDSFRVWEVDLPVEFGGPEQPSAEEEESRSGWKPRLVETRAPEGSEDEITPRQTPPPVPRDPPHSSDPDDDEPPPKAPWLRLVR